MIQNQIGRQNTVWFWCSRGIRFTKCSCSKRLNKDLTVVSVLLSSLFVIKPSPLMSIFLNALIRSSSVVAGSFLQMSTNSANDIDSETGFSFLE